MISEAIRAELKAHAEEEAPNECCGVLVLRDGVAERYVRGRNALESPYRYELAVFHSHPETEPRPSRTDRERSGLWAGRPFVIYGLKRDELRAWRVTREDAEEIELS